MTRTPAPPAMVQGSGTRSPRVVVPSWVLGVVAAAVPLELTARAADTPGPVWQSLGGAPVATLLLLVLGAAMAVSGSSGPRSSCGRLAVVVLAVAALRALTATALGHSVVDPLGHGAVLPDEVGAPVALALVAVAVALGSVTHRLHAPVAQLVIRVAAAGAVVVVATADHVATRSVASLVVALGLAAALTRADERPPLSPGGPLPAASLLPGVALAAASIGPHAVRFVLERYVERTVVVDGALHAVGPLITPALWAAALIGASGILIGVTAAWIGTWRSIGITAAGRHCLGSLRVAIPTVLSAALLVRVWALYRVSTGRDDVGDPLLNHVTANLVARGRGFQDPFLWIDKGAEAANAIHAPGFATALSVVSRLGGVGYVDHQWASILLGLPQIALAMMLAHALGGRRVALVAGFLCTVHPNLWITDGSLFVEGMMAGLTTAASLATYRWLRRPRRATALLIGLLIGLAALTRGEALLLVPLLLGCVVLVTRRIEWSVRWRHAALGVIAAAATLAPWTLYNVTRFEVFVPVSNNSNEVLFYANCDDVYDGPLLGYWSFDCQTRHRAEFGEPPGDQAQRARYWRRLGIEYALEHRDRLPIVVLARIGRQWELFRPGQTVDFAFIENRSRAAVQVGQAAYYAMMPLAIAGTFVLRRRRIPVLPMWVHAISVTVAAVYAYGNLRFRAPWEPIMACLAAVALVAGVDRLRAWGTRSARRSTRTGRTTT